MFVQSSLTNICSFNVVHLRCCGHYSTFVGKNRRSGRLLLFCFLKNAVLALQILCMMGMWQYRRKLAYAWTDRWASSAFLCSFVLMSLFLEHTDYTGMRSLVLARDDITNDAMLSFLAGTRNLMKIIVSRFKLREVQLRIIEFYFE